MRNKKYAIVIWSERDDRGTAIELWSGSSSIKAFFVVVFKYSSRIFNEYCRITILKNIDPELEVLGNLPKIILSLGNKSIPIFKRVLSLS